MYCTSVQSTQHIYFCFIYILQLDGATYSSKSSACCGGVGRNLAEGIAKIFGGSTFLSAVGNDQVNIIIHGPLKHANNIL